MKRKVTYLDAGVDIDKGNVLVEKIQQKVQSTYGAPVLAGVGGFASVYAIDEQRCIVASADGVGTKLLVAQQMGIHNTIGIDLVAMCINDLLCTGARGLFFMDYLATGKLEVSVAEQIIEGVVEGCRQAGLALLGGETAELPDMYIKGQYDLAGFAVGEVDRQDLLDGSAVQEGDYIVGLASTGIHANGLSLARRLIDPIEDAQLWPDLLIPTRIYTPYIATIDPALIHGLAHITGGGWRNIARIHQSFDYLIETTPIPPPIFAQLQERSGLTDVEMYQTFNMGVGMVIITSQPSKVQAQVGCDSWVLGRVRTGTGKMRLRQTEIR